MVPTTRRIKNLSTNLTMLWLWCLLTLKVAEGHVALTFPPARKYDLDFLDNGRTKAPCGMPKGSIKTSLPQGAAINVTWHLAYPHRGGYKLELLDAHDEHLADLTPVTTSNKYIGLEDSTAQSHQVNLPSDVVCKDCTLRLLRQAQEWGHAYLFWSCADLDIVPPSSYASVCSGQGSIQDGLCQCDRLYSGNVCQYKDECWNDEDCGVNGHCVDIEATTYPKKQCYCNPGWFGEKCSRESPIKSTDVDLSSYTKRELSSEFTLHWKILKEIEEIEVVLKVKGSSYAALGWRPQSLTAACKTFPLVTDTIARISVTSATSSNSSPEPTSEPVAERSKRQVSEKEPETSGEATAEPEPSNEPKVETGPANEAEEQLESTSVTTVEADPTPEPNVGSDTTSELSSKPELEPETPQNPTSVNNQNAESDTEPKAEPEPEPTSEPEPQSDTKSNSYASSEPEPTSVPKSEPEPISESKSELESTSESSSEPEPTSEPKNDSLRKEM